MSDIVRSEGRFTAICRNAAGTVLWTEEFSNLLTQTGKALLMDQALAGAAYTAAEFMGLISSVSYSVISGGDTQASHAGWLEAGSTNAPTYSGTRISCVWGAATVAGTPTFAATKALSAGLVFTFTGAGTVEGAFIVAGVGAVSTIGSTAGTLYSAGTFGSAKTVSSSDTITVTYSTTLT